MGVTGQLPIACGDCDGGVDNTVSSLKVVPLVESLSSFVVGVVVLVSNEGGVDKVSLSFSSNN